MRVPDANMYDTEPNPVTGDKFVSPENVLIAAAGMHDMGRLFEQGGGRFSGVKGKGSRGKPQTSMKAK
jgi:hypothetical protein